MLVLTRTYTEKRKKKMSPLLVLKYGFAGVLMILFFLLFGAPSIEKYQAKQTIVVESHKDYDETDHPAITVCGTNGVSGWTNYDSSLHHGPPPPSKQFASCPLMLKRQLTVLTRIPSA